MSQFGDRHRGQPDGNWAKVRTYGEMATYINPSDPDILGGSPAPIK